MRTPAGRIVWLFVLIWAAQSRAGDSLDSRVDAVLKTPGFEHAHWGILVVDAKSGKALYERNPGELFCPASVTKLFTTAAALADLGPDFRFRTPVVRRGKVDEAGTLHGDLILVAQGDLSLGGRTGRDGSLLFENHDHTYANGSFEATLVPSDPLAGLDHLAREIHGAGIKAITGDVLIDDRLFDTAKSSGSGPARVTPIMVNDNVVDAVVTPAESTGTPATVKMVPETAFITMDAQVETVSESSKPVLEIRAVGPRRFAIRGRLPIGHKPAVRIYDVEEPDAFARALFIDALRKRGVKLDASPLGINHRERLPSRKDVEELPHVAEYTSPPFSEYLRVILKVSHNLHASTLPLIVAARHGERTLAAGLKREGQYLKTLGVDVDTISFGGGAGGERADLVTPRAAVALLRAMSQRPDFTAYESALPILGRDGTLDKAVSPESPARGHAHAKTGTYWVDNPLTGQAVLTSKALAGYLETSSGRRLAFAFFINEVPMRVSDSSVSEQTQAAGKLLGKLCEVFYEADGGEVSKAEAAAPR